MTLARVVVDVVLGPMPLVSRVDGSHALVIEVNAGDIAAVAAWGSHHEVKREDVGVPSMLTRSHQVAFSVAMLSDVLAVQVVWGAHAQPVGRYVGKLVAVR